MARGTPGMQKRLVASHRTLSGGMLPPALYAARAKRVIFLFMSGGPSHVDLFDPKPKLAEYNGKPLPFEMPKLVRTKTGNLLQSPFKFARHGQSGLAPKARKRSRREIRQPPRRRWLRTCPRPPNGCAIH